MPSYLFAKAFAGLTVADLMALCGRVGLDGPTALIRDDYWLRPEHLAEDLPPFLAAAAAAGCRIGWATAPWSPRELLDDPTPLRILAEHGVTLVRLGYLRRSGWEARRLVEEARRCCQELAPLAARCGVRAIVQLHGGCHPHNATAAWHCLRDADPAGIGVMLDPGNNLAQEGTESFAWQIGLLGEYLAGIGIKDARHAGAGSATRWVPLGQGENDWPALLTALAAAGHDLPRIFMPFYQAEDPEAALAAEVAFVHCCSSGAGVAPCASPS